MNKAQRDFYQDIRIRIADYLDKNNFHYGDLLLMAPDFFHLIVKLSLDPRVDARKKAKLVFAIAYFISPIDLLPELFFGPIGYMDDLALAAYILNDFINNNDTDILYEHWAGPSDVLAAVQNILTLANNFLGEGLWSRIKNKIGKI